MTRLLHLIVGLALVFVAASVSVGSAGSTSNTCIENPWPYARNTLRLGESITASDALETATARLAFETNGTLVLRRKSDDSLLWTNGIAGGQALTLQANGELVVTGSSGAVMWNAGQAPHNTSIAVLQDDCNFVLYTTAPLTNATWATNTQSCVEVHIVMHSHDDVGWLLTPERYYDGCYDPYGGVQSIISSVVQALAANASRTFVQVEQYFFNRWWVRQTPEVQAQARAVVASGQLDFINGGWSMHDEACVHQESAISNMEIGAQFLRREFGNTFNLSIGWHIDPFGHSSATPRLMAQMGFDAFFFWRTDYQQREFMQQTKTFETMWDSSPSQRDSVLMFTSIMYESYCMGCQSSSSSGFNMCPSGFCCMDCELKEAQPEWAAQFHRFSAQSVARRHTTDAAAMRRAFHMAEDAPLTLKGMASSYAQWIKEYAGGFRTQHVLIPWGCDFQHINAPISFQLMDDVFAEINGNPNAYGVRLRYSTPERYVAAVAAMNYSWPRNKHDYFIDSDNGHAYWSGYFSSRAEFKGFERMLMNERVAVELALSSVPAAAINRTEQLPRVEVLREALGVAQHHDSITGTEREHVRNRYQFLLTRGWDAANSALADAIAATTGVEVTACLLQNISSCTATEALIGPDGRGANVSAYIFNPLGWQRTEIVTIPMPTVSVAVSVRFANGTVRAVRAQQQPVWALTTSDDPTSPPHKTHSAELLVEVPLPPLALVEVIIAPVAASSPLAVPYVAPQPGVATLSNEHYSVYFNASSGQLQQVTNNAANVSSPLAQNILTYCPMGEGGIPGQPSGAYIFRTCAPDEIPKPFATTFQATNVAGPLCSEVRQLIQHHNRVHQTVRVCGGQSHIELISGIGVVDVGYTGVEVVMKLQTDAKSNGQWFTDAEALETERRVRNSRPNYPYTVTEPVASNFFPANAFAFVNDTFGRNLAVLADRSRATASLRDGELEFLVLRKLINDDWRGVDQALNESTRLLSTNRVIVNSRDLITEVRRGTLLQTHRPVVRFGAPSSGAWAPHLSGLAKALPPAVFLHTRTLLAPTTLLLRLQHLYAVGEGPLAVPVVVDFASVLPPGAAIRSVVETELNGVEPLSGVNSRRQQFKVCDAATGTTTTGPAPFISSLVNGGASVLLHPMDIRTFLLELNF